MQAAVVRCRPSQRAVRVNAGFIGSPENVVSFLLCMLTASVCEVSTLCMFWQHRLLRASSAAVVCLTFSTSLTADYGGVHNSLFGGRQIWPCTNSETASNIWTQTCRQWHQGLVDWGPIRYTSSYRKSTGTDAAALLVCFERRWESCRSSPSCVT